jgi:U3 small nucleolar RNA-associated protein 11
MKKAMELRSRSYKELNQRLKRSEKLNNAIQNLQSQRISMGKGSKRKIQDAEDGKPAVYKFQRQRCK